MHEHEKSFIDRCIELTFDLVPIVTLFIDFVSFTVQPFDLDLDLLTLGSYALDRSFCYSC